MAILYTDVGGGPTGETTILDQVSTTLHLVRVKPNQMRVLQQAGTHPVPFVQHPDWPNKAHLERQPTQPVDHNPPMERFVTRTICSGTCTGSPCHRARRT